ncbi:membrane protein insertion efficiency factor YidD [Bacteriovorax sp. Seq25_V]|uniref:membrane protein insertion efficiency factor YidD n=1 Tax=Bacteriovorax sp. Seq25_V TaxID=1201288 RepID=UPI000389E600|nr:membrane protein insertion efficiency factor YidD [Bacteriovorax sp. Seq25_V]EQC46646.1 YidD family protein [Bacteriovorax sp. Seq25_V]
MKSFFLMLIKFYQYFLSPFLGRNCRFHPTCSSYAKECFEKHDAGHALLLTTKRICRCHPFSAGGYDPVPEIKEGNKK